MTTQMAADAGDEREAKLARTVDAATAAVRQRWSSTLADDLLPVVYSMVSSPRGRVRFAAVCRSWRAAAREAPRAPALPWLLLSPGDADMTKRLHCPEDGAIVRVPLPGRRELVGCHDGGWIAATYVLLQSLRIFNLFSGAEVKLGEKQERLVCGDRNQVLDKILKIVFSEPPTSGDCILAAMTDGYYSIGLCRVGSTNKEWTTQNCHGGMFVDITFCNGELYGVRKNGEDLVKFGIDLNEDGAPVAIAKHRLAIASITDVIRANFSGENVSYIFDLHGKLALARRAHWSLNLEPFFKVFELSDIHANEEITTRYKHKWVEVTNLGDHALFLGRTFSKLVHLQANRGGGVERNHIYFSHHRCFRRYDFVPRQAAELLATSNEGGDQIYYMHEDAKNDITGHEVKRIRSVGYLTKSNSNHHGCSWVLPPDIYPSILECHQGR